MGEEKKKNRPGGLQPPGLAFHGTSLFTPHSRLQARVVEFGGEVVEGTAAQPTHILCDRGMGHDDLRKRMGDFPEG